MSGSSASSVARLKEEGNALFSSKKYKLVRKKYTEAIALDGKNAVLYANRSACYLALQEHLNAANDAEKALQIDPQYTKAIARLATAFDAMGHYLRSIPVWQRAPESLPTEMATPAEIKLREQYEKSLKASRAAFEDQVKFTMKEKPKVPVKNLPWELAKPLIEKPEYQQGAGIRSSAWVIAAAHEDFESGVKTMNTLKKVPVTTGPYAGKKMFVGSTGAIADLTNGILRDIRVVSLRSHDWVAKYNDQIGLEATQTRAWVSGSPETVPRDALARLASEGWNGTRPALSTTVRSWIMKAAVYGSLSGNMDLAVQHLGWAIEVITWGRKTWANVPTSERGVIFMTTFLIGVKNLYCIYLMKAIASKDGNHPKYSLKKLHDEAESLYNMVDGYKPSPLDPPDPVDPGFISSYLIYPKANALAHQGFYYGYLARMNTDYDIRVEANTMCMQKYTNAIMLLPLDEENHTIYFILMLHNMWSIGLTPVGEQLDLIGAMNESTPFMKKIWNNTSAECKHRDSKMVFVFRQEKVLRDAIAEGKVTLDTRPSIVLDPNEEPPQEPMTVAGALAGMTNI